ncbi:MAG: hypothetical protein ABS81_04095 [Pseudonocardia sp. SCN 72-86]|nr:MAG: hypothetical protein ABS81_04095 [Pseudonocardia sp. SCN 72-86]
MKALVIGGTGPTGPYLVEGLQQRGYDVTVLHRGTHEVPLPGEVEHIHTDPHFAETISEAVAGRTYDLVLATYGRLRLFVDVLKDVTDRLITIGATAYAPRMSQAATETSPRLLTNTLVQKIVATEDVLMKAHADGLYNVTHYRYPNLFGPRQLAPREWSIIRRIRDGRPWIPVIDGGLTLESRSYVENAAHAVLLGVDKPTESAGEAYNVNDDWTPSDADRVAAIAEHMGADVALLNLPRDVGRPAYFVGIGRDLSFSREKRAPHTAHSLLDNTKMHRQLGYVDPVPFSDAIARTVDWLMANQPEPGGEVERQLADPFDYAAEDRFKAVLDEFTTAAATIPFADIEYVHQYDHPTKPVGTP